VKVKKRALHLAVVAGIVGSAVTVAAPKADAAPPVVISNCAGFISGDIDPKGGVLPPDLIPFGIGGNNYGSVTGVTKGDPAHAGVIETDFGDVTAKGVRFSMKLTLQDTPALAGIAAASLQTLTLQKSTFAVAWKNDALGRPTFPTVALSESGKLNAVTAKVNAVKGTTSAVPGADGEGVVIGPVNDLTDQQTLIVDKSVTGGSFRLRLSLPGNALTTYLPIIIDTPNIAYNASAATIDATLTGTLNTALGAPITDATVVGTASTSTPGPSPGAAPPVIGTSGSYTIELDFLAGPLAAQNFALTVRTTGQIGTYPNLVQTSSLLSPVDAGFSDGSMHNTSQVGGPDIGTQVISVLQGGAVMTGSGYISNGPVGGVLTTPLPLLNGKNNGKANVFPDMQYAWFYYPVALASTINPELDDNLARAFLEVVLGLPVDPDYCSFGGLLLIFCASNPDLIPSDFAGFCQGILDPLNV